ncbi:MAG: Holliday junction branch migration protein RuvA [Sutterella sp.]|nr:Holliday junction branch migration protein RuvA [Sutterella sp.]
MIGRLHGRLIEKTPPQILIDVNGVGYEVDVPMSTFCNLPAEGQEITLLTHFVVREDAMLLYGFATAAERQTFRALIRISGIGPRIALAVLSGMSTNDFAAAVENGDAALLTRVPGIGKKTAERLVLELKGKLVGSAFAGALMPAASANQADITSALVALGYSEREAQAAVRTLPADIGVSDGIRQALKSLSR